MLKPSHLKRYKDIAAVLLKHGGYEILEETGLSGALGEEISRETRPSARAEDLAADLERLGPTFVKVGQLLSTRPDLLPLPYLEALARLQDDVEPLDFQEVREVVEDELGVRLSRAYARFDEEPVASASLGQVHRAVLPDGREVAVKVQRPNIRKRVFSDLDALEELARFLDEYTEAGRKYRFVSTLEELRRTLVRELDYRLEKANLLAVGANLERFERIVVPAPVDDYTTSRVLTMEYVHGSKLHDLSPVVLADLDGAALAEEIFRAYLQQFLVDGLFHADPHPGNVLLTPDHRIALLDLGMVGHLMPSFQGRLLRMVLAISEGEGEHAASAAMRMGEAREDFDDEEFRRRINELVVMHHQAPLSEIQVGRIVLQVTRTAAENGLRLPPELTLFAKALLNLDQIGRALDPDFDPNESVRRNASDILSRRMKGGITPGGIYSGLLETAEMVREMPGRFNRLLDMLSANRIRMKVDVVDEEELILSLQKIANRITSGLILAAMIVGAALMLRVETEFTILGYPGIAILLFLVAAAFGARMVIANFLQDRRTRTRRRG